MSAGLTKSARELLAQQYEQLLFNDETATPKAATVMQIVQWCDVQEISCGKWLAKNKTFRFTRAGIDEIREAYWSKYQEDLFTDFSDDNHQSASNKSAFEKQAANKPTDHLILAALTAGSAFDCFQHAFHPAPQVNLELDIDTTDFSNYNALIMIENRDSFNDWYKFQPNLEDGVGNILAIYRGDSEYSVAATKLRKKWIEDCPASPVIYFGDFDLAGLRIAISGKYSHLLLPATDYLAKHSIPLHYPFEQEKFLIGIEKDCPPDWRNLLKLMTDHKAGLRQQRMYDTHLVLYSG